MGNKWENGSELDDFFAIDGDNLPFEYDDDSTESTMQDSQADIETDGFTPASEENLSNLKEGCFVLVERDEVYCWAEVVSVAGNKVIGRLNNELSTATCMEEHHKQEITQFRRDQIKAMGCDRYCWCE